MKTHLSLLLICITSVILLLSIDTVLALWDDTETVKIFLANLDTSLSKKTLEQKKVYYTRTITQLELKISQYQEIRKILEKRLSGNEIATPIKSITWIVIDLPVVMEKPVVNTSIFQASECHIPLWENRCISTLTVNATSGKSFTVVNKSRNITSINLLKPDNFHAVVGWLVPVYSIWESTTRNSANSLQYGENKLELYEWDARIGSTVTLAGCDTGSVWNGSICREQSPEWTQTWETVIQWNANIDPTMLPCKNTSIKGTSNCILPKKITLTSYSIDKQSFPYSGWIIKYSPIRWATLELYGTIGISDDTSIVLASSTGKKLYAKYTDWKWSWKISSIQSDWFLQEGLGKYTLSFVNDESSGIEIRIQNLTDDIARSTDPVYTGGYRYAKNNRYLE